MKYISLESADLLHENLYISMNPLLVKSGPNKKGQKILAALFFGFFFSAASSKKGFKNSAARKFFGPSYFVTALTLLH